MKSWGEYASSAVHILDHNHDFGHKLDNLTCGRVVGDIKLMAMNMIEIAVGCIDGMGAHRSRATSSFKTLVRTAAP